MSPFPARFPFKPSTSVSNPPYQAISCLHLGGRTWIFLLSRQLFLQHFCVFFYSTLCSIYSPVCYSHILYFSIFLATFFFRWSLFLLAKSWCRVFSVEKTPEGTKLLNLVTGTWNCDVSRSTRVTLLPLTPATLNSFWYKRSNVFSYNNTYRITESC